MSEHPDPQAAQSEELNPTASQHSGGVDVDAGQVDIGGDVIGRDKIESAGGHIIHAAAGATVVIGERLVEVGEAPADEAPAPGPPPFKGLQYFEETDADLFFGREALSAQLAARLRTETFLAVVGASGSGKSSLVRAGLIPAVRRDHPHWQIHLITPNAHPIKGLAALLISLFESFSGKFESINATETLMDDLMRDARSLDLAATKALNQLPHSERLLLIVDQFEELFTACKDEHEQRAFVDNLLYASASETHGQVIVVIALRADFYAHCARFDNLREALAKRQEFIGAMNADDLRRAIEAPAQLAHWAFEPGLVDLFLRDVGNEPGAMPLLSHALLETWQRRRGHTLTLEGYHEAGGVHGAIAKTAETIFNQFKPEQQPIARYIFLRLTELGEGTQDTRRRVALNELMLHPEDAASIEAVLKTLADARLVTTGKDTAEVAHEALIREWPTLRRWLDEDREGLRLQRQLTEHAREWIALDRDPGALYRGTRLERAAEWAKDHAQDLNPFEREFFEASVALREREVAEREAARQKELNDARRLAEMAEARARAERRVTRLTRAMLGGVTIVALAAVSVLLFNLANTNATLQRALNLVEVPAGTAIFGTASGAASGDYLPVEQSALAAYAIEPYEVTNRRYLACVQAKICSPPNAPAARYESPDVADLPVVNVTALQASQFCDWLGLRLPTELEWERAARGVTGRSWPWGNEKPTSSLQANFIYTDTQPPLAPVGRSIDGATPEGIYDLAGNVWEWTSSNFNLQSKDKNWLDVRQQPPDALSVRGGGADSTPDALGNIAYRLSSSPFESGAYIGFRCAVSR